MVTKYELKRLEQPSRQNKELHYTIGGPVEMAVHSTLESERIGKLNTGHRTMNTAVENFRHNMALKSREGLARSQFQHSVQGNLPVVDTDLGYGAGQDPATVNQYVAHGLKQKEVIKDDRVKAFAQTMTENRTLSQELER